jgi:hypothetical protein
MTTNAFVVPDMEYRPEDITQIVADAINEEGITDPDEWVHRIIDETVEYVSEWLTQRGDVELSNILQLIHFEAQS